MIKVALVVVLGSLLPSQDTEIDLPTLVKIAERYGLPQPPADAPLVLGATGWTTSTGNRSSAHDPGLYRPGFRTGTGKDGHPLLLMGWETSSPGMGVEHRPPTRPFSLEPQAAAPLGYVLDCGNMESVVAMVQVARRGDQNTARAIWASIQGVQYFREPIFQEGVGRLRKSPTLLLGRCVYEYLLQSTLTNDVDLGSVHGRMTELAKEFPALFNAADWAGQERVAFLRDLGTTVAAPKPAPGSVEALLVSFGNVHDRYGRSDYFSDDWKDRNEIAQAIFRRGLEAIPVLDALSHDLRITRHISQAFMKKAEERLRLGQVAARLLDEITGSQGRSAVTSLKDHSRPELEFFSDAALTMRDGVITHLHPVPLWILGETHPEALSRICGMIPAGCDAKVQLFDLTSIVLGSKLSPDAKTQAVTGLAQRLKKDERLRPVLQNLAKADPKGCAALLLPILKGLPEDVEEAYWTCAPASYQHVVMQLEIDEVWKEYLQAVRKASVGLRMEMMNAMNYGYIEQKNRSRRLALLAEFLDDAEVRDRNASATKYQGPCAGFTFPRIEVRNFVAEKLASLLRLPSAANEFWTDEQWADLRTKVRERLKEETLPHLKD